MSSTWIPRAAMSVATRTRVLPSVKAARLRSRAPCPRLPCSSTAGTPAAVSCLASFLAVCLVRMNSTLRSWPLASCMTTAALSAALTEKTWCVIVETGAMAGSTEWVVGCVR